MKKTLVFLLPVLLCTAAFSQTKPAKKEKAPTRKEMEDMQKQAQSMMEDMMKEMDPEDKKMMDSLGIKMPDMKKMGKLPAHIDDAALKQAMEDENRIVPKKDAARIASIPQGLTNARMPSYVNAVQQKTETAMGSQRVTIAKDIYGRVKTMAANTHQAGSMSVAFWLSGQPDIALYLLGRVCAEDPNDTDNLSNYASMLIMQGGQHFAIPVLQLLNARFPKNNTILNNLGQAWFGLGDIAKSTKYLDSALAIYPYHPQANLTKAAIEESKGNTTKAIEHVKKSIKHAYTKDKEDRLSKLGYKFRRKDIIIPFRPDPDPLGLEGVQRPDYPTTVDQVRALYPLWQEFNKECDARIQKLQKEIANAGNKYAESAAATAKRVMQTINSGAAPTLVMQPMYAVKAGLELTERKAYHQEKMKKLTTLYTQLQSDLESIRKSRRPVAEDAPCSVNRDATNEVLKKLNTRKKEYDVEALRIFRHYANDMAYWSQYGSMDKNAANLIAMEFQVFWLQKNRELQPVEMSSLLYAYQDCKEEEKGKPGKLREFDDIACNYKSTVNVGIIVQENNCSHTTTTYNFGVASLTERELGAKYTGSTVRFTPKVSYGASKGPGSIEAFVKADISIELDEKNDVKEWGGTVTPGVEIGVGVSKGPVKVDATVTGEVQIEVGSNGIGDINMVTTGEVSAGAFGQKIGVGVEDKVSVISGHGAVTGTGLLSGQTFTKW